MKEENKIDSKRRQLLKAAAVGVGASMVSFIAIERNKLMEVLRPVSLSEIIGFVEAEEGLSKYEKRAREREAEIKKICRAEADKICLDKGEDSAECSEARNRCEKIVVKATPPKPGTRFVMALDINKCIGCRRCAYACVMENNTDRDIGIEWIHVLEVHRDDLELLNTNIDYGEEAPKKDYVYIPMACMHCDEPSCVYVCPVVATWKEDDGIVVVDYDRCIGCRYCITACPYGARRFNWKKPRVPVLELNPNMHILGNVLRYPHVVEKCIYCIQRTRDGGIPACVEVCPVGARSFGDINDPEGPIRRILEKYGAFVLRPETGNKPMFFYYFGPARTPPRSKEEG